MALIVFDPIFRKKVEEMERVHPRENFHLGFDAYHLLQLSTSRFFCLNGKQPGFQLCPLRQMYETAIVSVTWSVTLLSNRRYLLSLTDMINMQNAKSWACELYLRRDFIWYEKERYKTFLAEN